MAPIFLFLGVQTEKGAFFCGKTETERLNRHLKPISNLPENKMGTRPVFPLLLSMAFPAMLSMFIQSMYNVVDSMFVARIGEDALTAVSLAFPIQNLLLAVAVGTGVGVNSYISRKLGEGNQPEADSAVSHGLLLALLSSAAFVILGLLFIRPFFSLYTDSETVLALGVGYTQIVTYACFGMQLHIVIEKVLQATGNMVYPMVMQAVGAIVNIILDPILIFGLFGAPALGVNGAAIATVIGQLASMGLSFWFLLSREHAVALRLRGFRFHARTVRDVYAVGFPSIVMNSLGSVLVMGLNGILVGFSNMAVSLFGVYFKLQSFVFMPVSGLIQGAMPIMGYNYGAGNRKRLQDALSASLLVAALIMAAGAAVFLLFPAGLLLWFDASKEMLAAGVPALRIICLSYLPAAVSFIISTLFQAIGRGFYSLLISLLRQLLLTLLFAFLLAPALGLTGVWLSFPLAEAIAAGASLFLLARVRREVPLLRREKA